MAGIKLVDALSWYILVALILQIARSFFGDSGVLSSVNLAIFFQIMLFVMVIFARLETNNLVLLLLAGHVLLLATIGVNWAHGKQLIVLVLAHIDNLKFLLPLGFLVALRPHFFNLTPLSKAFLSIARWIIICGVMFGALQQFSYQFIAIFPHYDDFNEMHRYGILRVPSYFGEINAFGRAAFLLIPLSFLTGKSVRIAICIALIAFILSFSRQMILGLGISVLFGTMEAYTMAWGRLVKIFAYFLFSIMLIITLFLSAISFSREGDDRLFSVPERYIRLAVARTAVEAVSDNPALGVGPGYFGGNIGKKFNITEDLYGYGLLKLVPFFDLEGKYYTDTLWPQLAAEYGILGFLVILSMFYAWYRRLSKIVSSRARIVASMCFMQLILVAFTSPAFNFLYFTIPILVLSLICTSESCARRLKTTGRGAFVT